MSHSLLSICICFRNAEGHLLRCLESLAQSTQNFLETRLDSEKETIEWVLVDHCSTDRSSEIVREFTEEFFNTQQSKLSGRVKLKFLDFDPPGIAAVRNFAWRNSESDWVAFIDSDCLMKSDWVAKAIEGILRFKTKASIGALGGANYIPDLPQPIYQAFKLLLPSYIGGHGSTLNQVYGDLREVNHLPTLNVIYKRGALENIGGFQEHFLKVGEDLDLSARLRAYGYRLLYLPDLGVEHLLRSRTWDWAKNMYLYGRGRVFFLWNHPERFELKFLAPPMMVAAYLVSLAFPLAFLTLFTLHWVAILALTLRQVPSQEFRWRVWIFAGFLGWLTHLSYGLGAFRQMLAPWRIIW